MRLLKVARVSRCVHRQLTGLRPYDNVRDLITPRTSGSQQTRPQQVTFDEAVECVKSGDYVYLHHCASTPVDLLNALARRAKKENLRNIHTTHALLLGDVPFAKDESIYEHIRPLCYFVSPSTRKAVNDGRADYITIFLNETGRLYDTKHLPVDVAFMNLSPPDEHGFCTLGVSVDSKILNMSSAAVRNAKTIVATFNKSQPRTFGDSQIHISHIDFVVPEADSPIVAINPPKIKEVEAKIGKLIGENLVPNEATLQLGIGSLPDAVLNSLVDHKNLGVHTEMISDGIVDLILKGNVTNSKKTVYPGKAVLAFAMGSRKFYDLMDNNTCFLFGSVGFTNAVPVIMAQHRMTSINSAIEIDLCGQICADTIGSKFFSGFGGQTDFVYGSAAALDGQGKSIIGLPSQTEKGEPKIVPFLKEGAGVVSTRAHARYIVTEYGIASLWGKPMLQRAAELISIAHPDGREFSGEGRFQTIWSNAIQKLTFQCCLPKRNKLIRVFYYIGNI
ncbi:Acetyl-CoA deacylase [Aphelenchoides bicaudatus]|nr:Acetyl-CoA deacylase [Aphelenchoides bicaudatus]